MWWKFLSYFSHLLDKNSTLWIYPQYIFLSIQAIINPEVIKMIDYSPLWQTMKQKNISQYKLLQSGIDNKTLDTLKKNNNITLLTVEKLCNILNCTPNDIITFIKDKD